MNQPNESEHLAKLAIATLALEDIAAIHADHDWPETYAGRVKATANAALEAIGPHVVEFCGGETPELTAAYDRLEKDQPANDTPTPRTATPRCDHFIKFHHFSPTPGECMDFAADLERQLAAATAWRPIETAPKDGKSILAWDDGPIVVHWDEVSSAAALDIRMGWASTYDSDYMSYNEHKPTHWQPLPNPPTDNG
jgi:hypothetical protein